MKKINKVVPVLHDNFLLNINFTSQIRYLAGFLQINLRLQKQRVKAIQEELPRENSTIAQAVVQLIERLQDHWPIHNDRVELRFQAKNQSLQDQMSIKYTV